MKTSRRLTRAVGAVVALLAVVGVTACGGGSSSSDSSAPATSTGTPAPATVTIGLPLKVSTLDPDLALEPSNLDALHLLSGTLTTIPGKGGALSRASRRRGRLPLTSSR